MAEKTNSGFAAIEFFRVGAVIDGNYSRKQNQKSEQELWVEENCEGRFFIGNRGWNTANTHLLPFLFESEFDMMAFKLRWM